MNLLSKIKMAAITDAVRQAKHSLYNIQGSSPHFLTLLSLRLLAPNTLKVYVNFRIHLRAIPRNGQPRGLKFFL